jgi:hypothetical protein
MRKRLFIASSSEGLDVAYAIQTNLENYLEVTVWPQGAFTLSKTAIESLVEEAKRYDGAAFVFTPDDETVVRERRVPSVRDNVVFELGLFIGSIGRDVCFIVKPRSFSNTEFPTDLLGITSADYDDSRMDDNLVAAVGPCSFAIKRASLPKKTPERERAPGVEGLITSRPYRLFFNPKTQRSKRMVFKPEGLIVEGNNKNEHSWRIVNGKLELLQLEGQVHSRFMYNIERDVFEHTNDTDTLSIRCQFMVPDVSAEGV